MSSFVQKRMTMHVSFSRRTIVSLTIEPTTFVLHCKCWYHSPTSVFNFECFWHLRYLWWTCVFYRDDWLSIKFCEYDSFRKLYLFFENTSQYLRGISQDTLVYHLSSCRSLISANRRRAKQYHWSRRQATWRVLTKPDEKYPGVLAKSFHSRHVYCV